MGNYRFKLSDMMPKSWFCKLKEFGKSKSQGSLSKTKKKLSATSSSTIKPLSPRQSYYYSLDHSREKLYNSPLNPKTPDTHFPDPPRKSKRKARKRTSVSSPKIVTSISSACGCHNTVNSVWKSENFPGSPISTDSFDHTTDWIDSCNSKNPSSETDIIFHLNNQKSFMKNSDHVDGCKSCNPISELELHPILTRPQKNDELIVQMKKKEEKPAKFEKKTDESLAFLPEKKTKKLEQMPRTENHKKTL